MLEPRMNADKNYLRSSAFIGVYRRFQTLHLFFRRARRAVVVQSFLAFPWRPSRFK
jgi:hypothetical protein